MNKVDIIKKFNELKEASTKKGERAEHRIISRLAQMLRTEPSEIYKIVMPKADEYNDAHEPAGSGKGGQFAKKETGSGVEPAETYARNQHKGITRMDKVTPYSAHLETVVNDLKNIGITDEDILSSAWLHDTVEDTDTTLNDLSEKFGEKVATLVSSLSKNEELPREERERLYVEQLKNAPLEAKIIKLGDINANLNDMGNSNLTEKYMKKMVQQKLRYIEAMKGDFAEIKSKYPKISNLIKSINKVVVENGGNPITESTVDDYKVKKTEEIKPKKEERDNLKKVDAEITNNVNQVIKESGYQDKVNFVEMQGSYAKHTDLTGSSDLDLFIGFNKSVSREEFEKIGLEIGQKALSKHSPYERYAEHPFTEAMVGDVEVQIVPTYDISLDEIKSGNLLSATDRTPHQTRFMNENLTDEQKGDVRLLKNFMKESRTYGSDEKIKGFSGYSAETLVHELGSFDKAMSFFADFEKGKEIGKPTDKHNTPFTLVDPIDPNRNLVSAFSDQKIARMVKTSKEFLKTGEIPKPTTSKMDSIGISLEYNERSDDKLFGEINRSITAISKHLGEQGYKTKTEDEKITNNWNVSIPRVSYDLDKENNKIDIHFGLDKFNNATSKRIRGPPVENQKAVDSFRNANPNSKIQMEVIDGEKRLVRYEEREHKNAQDALNGLLSTKLEKIGISKGIIDDIKSNGFLIKNKKEREFENLV